jgi:hypothetical protein
VLYREVRTAHGHAPAPLLYLMREIYVGDSDEHACAEARPWLLQYWELWNRYTQFTRGGQLPDSYDFWRRQAPMLHAMSFEEILAHDMVLLGGPDRAADAVPRLSGQLDLMSLALIFKRVRWLLPGSNARCASWAKRGGAADPSYSRPRRRRQPRGRSAGASWRIREWRSWLLGSR